ncbi:hypothetical protein MTP99_007515 [Tenebrio molitor]|nr:hypothetical protein MTP99_007515 [Tenebrio molitor]
MDVCVCLVGADGRVVEGRHSSDTTARSAGFKSQAGWASHGCLCCISCCVVQKGKKEKRGWVWVAGESTPEPRRTKEKRGKSRPQGT